jgi:hypothetical protein
MRQRSLLSSPNIILEIYFFSCVILRRSYYADYIASDSRVSDEWWTGKDFEESGLGLCICPEGLKETTKTSIRIAGVRPRFGTSTSRGRVKSVTATLTCSASSAPIYALNATKCPHCTYYTFYFLPPVAVLRIVTSTLNWGMRIQCNNISPTSSSCTTSYR